MRTERVDGLILEDGPDSMVASKPAGRRLVERLGLGAELVGSAPGGAAIAWRSRLHPIPQGTILGVPTDLRAMARSSLFGASDVARIAAEVVLPRSRSDVDESVGSLLRRRLGHAFTHRLARPLMGGVGGGDLDRLSAEAAFPQLVDWERHHGSLIRGARSAVAVRPRCGAPFVALWSGMDRIVDALAARLAGAHVACDEATHTVGRAANAYRVTTDRRTIDADLVVLAVAPAVASRLLGRLAADIAGELASFASRCTAVVHLAYPGLADRGGALGHGFVVAPGEPLHLTGLTVASTKWPHRAPSGTLLLRAYLGDSLAGATGPSDDELLTLVRADLRSVFGLRDEPSVALVRRLPDAMPERPVGHLARVATIRARLAAAHQGLVLVGGAYDGVGIPAVTDGVDHALTRILPTWPR